MVTEADEDINVPISNSEEEIVLQTVQVKQTESQVDSKMV